MAYENFTTYTEFDEGGDLTVDSATKVSWLDLKSIAETAYLYKDKGVNHFSGDFTHKFEIQYVEKVSPGIQVLWMLANSVNDLRAVIDANEDALAFLISGSSDYFYLRIYESGVSVNSNEYFSSTYGDTTYYIEMVRDDDGGANNTGRLTMYIRTGSHSGTLRDTLVVDSSAGEQNDFRYIYPITTSDASGSTGYLATGFTQNLDIGEAGALNANDASSLTQITVPSVSVKRAISIPNVESLSQITAPTVEKGWLYSPDISCSAEITIPSFTVNRQLAIPNVECLTQVTIPSLLRNCLDAIAVSCNAEITVPTFTVKREITIPNIESLSEVGIPDFVKQTPLNAPDVSSNTQVTVASIYKELFPSDIECSSEVEAADLEYIKIGRMNVDLPMITAQLSGGHGGFLNAELPMITAEMRAGARLNVILPMITAELEGKVGVKADLNVTLPMITAEMTGTVEVLGELNVTLPMITARMSGTAGHVGQLNVTLPMITAALTGYTDIDGQLNVTLPMIEARLTGTNDRFAVCTPLRYEEPELE